MLTRFETIIVNFVLPKKIFVYKSKPETQQKIQVKNPKLSRKILAKNIGKTRIYIVPEFPNKQSKHLLQYYELGFTFFEGKSTELATKHR